MVSATFSLLVVEKLFIETSSLAPARARMPYRFELAASGGAPPYIWSGVLPGELSIVDGAIEGTPSAPGTVHLSIQVADDSGQIAAQSFPLDVLP
jgi:hypothetical protein